MMKVTHGQVMDEASRAALASGRAEPALRLLIDSFMAMHDLSLDAGDALAGGLLEAEPPAALAPDALARVLAAIEQDDAVGEQKFVYRELIHLPASLRDAIGAAEADTGWRSAGLGIRKLRLGLGGEARAEIVRTEAGTRVPWHTHKGQEVTLCLSGGFSDGRGAYGPGDLSIADPTVRHQPRTDDDGPCFVLTVTDAGLKFEGLLGAIQKLVGG
jgi:putative transcriptional regulator